MATNIPTPVPAPPPPPAPRPTATAPSAVPPTSVNPNYVPPAPVPRSQVDRSPGAVQPAVDPGLETGNVITITVPVSTNPSELTPAANTDNNVVVTATQPGGSSGAIQFNSAGSFGGSANLKFAQNGLFVGGVPTTLDASGYITASKEFRVGRWSGVIDRTNDNWGRFRIADQPTARTPFYGFTSSLGIEAPNRVVVITNEEQDLHQAICLFDTGPYPQDLAFEGTLFGVSAGSGTAYGSTGLEANWRKMLDLTNCGNLKIGSSLQFTPSFHPIPISNSSVGVRFADGTFQYTTVKAYNEGTQVSNSVVGLNFVGSGVTATNSGGNITVTVPGGGGLSVSNSAGIVVANATGMSFDTSTGAVQVGSVFGNTATISFTPGITVKDEDTSLGYLPALNFTGAGVSVSAVGNIQGGQFNIDIPGGGAGTIAVQEEGTNVVASASTVNFVGTGVTASNVGGVATVTVNTTNINTVYDAGSSITVGLNYNNGQWQNYAPSGGTVDITISNIPTGGEMTIFFQTGSTSTAITWHGPTVFFWEGGDDQPSTSSGTRDVVTIKNNGGYYFAKFSKGYAT